MEAFETHHLTKHAVTELLQGDSSRNIVEIIFRISGLKTERPTWKNRESSEGARHAENVCQFQGIS